MSYIREYIYNVKLLISGIFCYPKNEIRVKNSLNYDEYWRSKRGKNIGNLSSWQKERADFILRTLSGVQNNIELGDIGCGEGSILNYLRKNLKQITRCIGYDNSAVALDSAAAFDIQTVRLDISQTDTYEKFAEVDYYLLLEVLEHVPHSETLLLTALERARKGVFFSFPNTGYVRHRTRLLLGKFPLQWRVLPSEHVRFWTYSDLKWWLNAIGIKECQIHSYQGLPILNKVWPGLFAAAFIIYVPKR